jgi:hypothetical protein
MERLGSHQRSPLLHRKPEADAAGFAPSGWAKRESALDRHALSSSSLLVFDRSTSVKLARQVVYIARCGWGSIRSCY